MPEKVSNELIYEVLKDMQKRLDRHENLLRELHIGISKAREDIHEMRGDFLRMERWQSELEIRVDRIETRLDLSDAPKQ